MWKSFTAAGASLILLSGCAGFFGQTGAEVAARKSAILACTQQLGVNGGVIFEENSVWSGLSRTVTMTAKPSEELTIRDASIVRECIDQANAAVETGVASFSSVPVSTCPEGSPIMLGGARYCVGLK